MDAFTLNLLNNDEVLDVDQDPAGNQEKSVYDKDDIEVYSTKLLDGSTVLGIFNLSEKYKKVTTQALGVGIGIHIARDLCRQQIIGKISNVINTHVIAHEACLLRISK